MVPWKSSIGEISSKISSKPDLVETSVRPSSSAAWVRACQVSFPINQSKLSTWRARRSGTSMASAILAKERRRGPAGREDVRVTVREAAKRGPSGIRLDHGEETKAVLSLAGPRTPDPGHSEASVQEGGVHRCARVGRRLPGIRKLAGQTKGQL